MKQITIKDLVEYLNELPQDMVIHICNPALCQPIEDCRELFYEDYARHIILFGD